MAKASVLDDSGLTVGQRVRTSLHYSNHYNNQLGTVVQVGGPLVFIVMDNHELHDRTLVVNSRAVGVAAFMPRDLIVEPHIIEPHIICEDEFMEVRTDG